MGNSSSALPYSIDAQVGTDEYGWNIHEGKQTSGDKAAVTVFVGKKPKMAETPADKSGRNRGMMMLPAAIHHFQHCKRVRHPHILQVYATLDTDNPGDADSSGGGGPPADVDPKKTTGDLIIVTEPCVSLQVWLQQNSPTSEQLAWGLQSMVQSLHFLHSSANLAHGCVCPSSFYVNRAGDIKLWNFSLVTPIGADTSNMNTFGPTRHFRDYDAVLCPATFRSPERVEGRWEAIQTAGVHSMDSYSLGILIGVYYQAAGLPGIPQPLQKAVQRLQTPNIRMRPRLQPLLKCPIFTSPYQSLQVQLTEVPIQPVEQKISFWQSLGQTMANSAGPNSGIVDQNMAVYKILPLIKTTITTICQNEALLAQDLYRREVLAVTSLLFFIAENYLTPEQFKTELKPLVGLLFNVKDRGVRGTLLQKMSILASNLDASTLNSKVFEPMCSGFSDSSAALRELTLKSTLLLVPHLTAPNLEKLTRYLVRLQTDSEVSIRTNTVIFVAKIATHLTPVAREKLILPAFVRAMKDNFAPCRLAALQCMKQAPEFFEPKMIASNLLPAIAPHLLDSDASCRKEAFQAMESLLVGVRAESEKMRVKEQQRAQQQSGSLPQQQQQQQSQPSPAPASTGSYLSGLSSWMTSSAQPTEPAPTTTQPMQQQAPPQLQKPPVPPPQAPMSAPTNLPSSNAPTQQFAGMNMNSGNDFGGGADADDGWGDDDDNDGWGDDDLDVSHSNNGGVEEDPFASIGMKTTNTGMAARKLSTGGTKKLVINKKTASPAPVAIKKLSVKDDDLADGWDDF